jgi:hypothetical protein
LTLVGAADGDTIALGVPNDRMYGGPGAALVYTAWVTVPDAVLLRVCNVGGNPQKYVGVGSIRVDVWKH